MRKILIILIWPWYLYAQDSLLVDPLQCIKWARENHPYRDGQQMLKEKNVLAEKNYNSQWYPQLGAVAQASYQSDAIDITMMVPDFSGPQPTFNEMSIKAARDQYKIGLDVNQMLFDGGAVKAQKLINYATTNAEWLQYETELHKISAQVSSLFFTVLTLNENLKLLNIVWNTLENRRLVLAASLAAGVAEQSDVDAIIIEQLKNKQQQTEMQLSIKNALSALSLLTGHSISLAAQLQALDPDSSIFAGLVRPEIQTIEAQQQVTSHAGLLVKSQRMPKLYAFAQAGYGKPGMNFISNEFSGYYMVGLSLKWTIWDWGKATREKQSYLIQNNMLESRKQAFVQNIEIQEDACLAKIEQLQRAIAVNREIVALRENISLRTQAKVDNGTTTTTIYLNELNAEIQAKIQLQSQMVQLLHEKYNYLIIKGLK